MGFPFLFQHWIRLEMMPNVAVESLRMLVDPADSSYMPTLLVIRWGNSLSKLCQVTTINVAPSDNNVTLLHGIKEVVMIFSLVFFTNQPK